MLNFHILMQPTDATCGPTSLQALYAYYGDSVSLDQIMREIPFDEERGVYAVTLACHALKRGYTARIHSFNLNLFDPTWEGLDPENMAGKLMEQSRVKKSRRLREAAEHYLDFFRLGGRVELSTPSTRLLLAYLDAGHPVLAGLSATFLYRCAREATLRDGRTKFDDVRGVPTGHFVVVVGCDAQDGTVTLADPYRDNPVSGHSHYSVDADRFIHSVLLGIVTYDANLLVLEPPEGLNWKAT